MAESSIQPVVRPPLRSALIQNSTAQHGKSIADADAGIPADAHPMSGSADIPMANAGHSEPMGNVEAPVVKSDSADEGEISGDEPGLPQEGPPEQSPPMTAADNILVPTHRQRPYRTMWAPAKRVNCIVSVDQEDPMGTLSISDPSADIVFQVYLEPGVKDQTKIVLFVYRAQGNDNKVQACAEYKILNFEDLDWQVKDLVISEVPHPDQLNDPLLQDRFKDKYGKFFNDLAHISFDSAPGLKGYFKTKPRLDSLWTGPNGKPSIARSVERICGKHPERYRLNLWFRRPEGYLDYENLFERCLSYFDGLQRTRTHPGRFVEDVEGMHILTSSGTADEWRAPRYDNINYTVRPPRPTRPVSSTSFRSRGEADQERHPRSRKQKAQPGQATTVFPQPPRGFKLTQPSKTVDDLAEREVKRSRVRGPKGGSLSQLPPRDVESRSWHSSTAPLHVSLRRSGDQVEIRGPHSTGLRPENPHLLGSIQTSATPLPTVTPDVHPSWPADSPFSDLMPMKKKKKNEAEENSPTPLPPLMPIVHPSLPAVPGFKAFGPMKKKKKDGHEDPPTKKQ